MGLLNCNREDRAAMGQSSLLPERAARQQAEQLGQCSLKRA